MIESEKTHFTKVYSFSRLWYGHQELLVQMNREERRGGGGKGEGGGTRLLRAGELVRLVRLVRSSASSAPNRGSLS